MASPSDAAYLLGRDPEESKRLNAQHAFLVDVIGGTPIHPSIPTANIRSIADARARGRTVRGAPVGMAVGYPAR
ncbi:hypothetical protein CNMCM8714_006564 [Aspergillus fumigatus]|nr:hypothetical protein CNMCM8714_006564 [Aspergillus fumigatus]